MIEAPSSESSSPASWTLVPSGSNSPEVVSPLPGPECLETECLGPESPDTPPPEGPPRASGEELRIQRFNALFAAVDLSPCESVPGFPKRAPHWCMLTGPARVCWVCLVWWFFGGLPELSQDVVVADLSEMPAPKPWDKRYVRASKDHGQEVFLVRKGMEQNTWVMLFPDRSLKTGRLSDRTTITSQAPPDCYFAPVGQLSAAEKTGIVAAATQNVNDRVVMPTIPHFDPKAKATGVKRFFSVLISTPALSAKALRWSLRTPARAFGLFGFAFLVTETMTHLGIPELISRWAFQAKTTWSQFLTLLSEANEFWRENIQWVSDTYSALEQVISPTRLAGWAAFLAFVAYQCWYYESEDYEGDSVTSSAPPTPPSEAEEAFTGSEPNSPRSDKTLRLMEEMALRQKRLEEELREQREDAAVRENVQKIKGETGWSQDDRKMLQQLTSRVQSFEEKVRADREGDTGPRTPSPKLVHPQPKSPVRVPPTEEAARSHSCSPILEESVAQSAHSPQDASATPEKREPNSPLFSTAKKARPDPTRPSSAPVLAGTGAVLPVLQGTQHGLPPGTIAMLMRMDENPQQVWVRALMEYEDWDPEFMATAWGHGYQVRVAPPLLTEILRKGERMEVWAERWLRDHGLSENSHARELKAWMKTLDSLLFGDEPLPNFVNQVCVERLGKKALGLMHAFKACQSPDDWRRPQGKKDGSKWTSKVDWEAAKRIDPELASQDTGFRMRHLEDEIRKELTREAMVKMAAVKTSKAGVIIPEV